MVVFSKDSRVKNLFIQIAKAIKFHELNRFCYLNKCICFTQ